MDWLALTLSVALPIALTLVLTVATLALTLLSIAPFVGLVALRVRGEVERLKIERAVLAAGVAAPALILAVDQLRRYGRVSHSLKVELTLEVQPADRPPFTVRLQKRVLLVQIAQLMPGRVVEVRYDPADPSRVAIPSLSAR
jgi:hypothetical protein